MNGGAIFLFMGRKDIPDCVTPARQERLEDITVVMDPDTETVVTTYGNRNGLRDTNLVSRDKAEEEEI